MAGTLVASVAARCRRTKRAAVAAIALVTVVAPATAAAPPHDGADVVVRPDVPVFWDGPTLAVAAEDVDWRWWNGWSYQLDVRAPARRLRVGVDLVFGGLRQWADGRDPGAAFGPPRPGAGLGAVGSRFRVEVQAPDGRVVSQWLTGGYSAEVFLADAVAGAYTLRVVPRDHAEWVAAIGRSVRDGDLGLDPETLRVRFRALAERSTTKIPKGAALPNLRILPPFEVAMATPTYTYGPGASHTGLNGTTPSCMPEEYEEEVSHGLVALLGNTDPDIATGVRCLRFSAGIENIGRGPLALHTPVWPKDGDDLWWDPTHPADFPVYQRIYTPFRGYEDKEWGTAGTAQFHLMHAHLHFQDIYRYELWAYDRTSGSTTGVPAAARKRGAAPGDEKIARWDSFDNCPAAAWEERGAEPCAYTSRDAAIFLGAGWADIYEWNRSGQYVPFPTDAVGSPIPGHYLLVGTADAANGVIESDETDNVAYTHVAVATDGSIEVVERGYGSGPSDPARVVLP